MSDFIRDAAPGDLPRIVEIYNASIPSRRSVGDLQPVSVESRLGWFAAHSPECRPLWVLAVPEVVGWISLQSFGPLKTFEHTAEVSLFIAPPHQRRGYGTMLLSRMIEACPRLGVDTLLGTCFAHNAGTIRLNEKLGFERWGLFPGVADLDRVAADLVFMGLKVQGRVHPASPLAGWAAGC